ncbi:MAG: PACE efflux transporter [Burkholderiales bacterium]|nr:PACE efflux transporter [Burkholderiales bacterium]
MSSPSPIPGLQGLRRRVVYVSIYELIAIAVVTWGLAGYTGQGLEHSGIMAVASSAVAIAWNVLFNTLFERWEARQHVRGRSLRRRVAHAVGFEGGLVVTLVPMFAWWFGISLWEALVMDLGLIAFFLCYTFVFNWGFDKVFGLPASALGAPAAS